MLTGLGERGDPSAAFVLAIVSSRGLDGMPRSEDAARRWLSVSAQGGYPVALEMKRLLLDDPSLKVSAINHLAVMRDLLRSRTKPALAAPAPQ